MSHVTTVNCQIKDLDTFADATATFDGAEFLRDQKRFKGWGSESSPCVHAIKVKGTSHEIGLRWKSATDPSQGFELAADFYDGGLTRVFGPSLVNLRNEYSAKVAEKTLRRQGYMVRRQQEQQRITVYGTKA
jgi:hypothetical protein